MEIHLEITGWLLMVLSLLHFTFPRYLRWKQDLVPLSLLNRQIMYVHSFFIAFFVFLMGLLCVSSGEELVGSVLGKRICVGLGVFWVVRLIVQFVGYSSRIWKGKRFETIIHVLVSILWIYLSLVFLKTGLC